MGLVFDRATASKYAEWRSGPNGQAAEAWVRACLPALLHPRPGERALEIGCGDGIHLVFLKELGLKVDGLDASPVMVDLARDRLGQRCAVRKGAAEDLPFEDNSFDLALLIHTLEFVDNPYQALREAARVARRAVFVAVMNSLSWQGLARRIPSPAPDPIFGRGRFFSLWELKALIRQAMGDVPLCWRSSLEGGPILGKIQGVFPGKTDECTLPFGSYLGLAATILYRFRTDNLGVKLPVRGAGKSVVSGATMKGTASSRRAVGR
ncbi:MAG: class I SAM-dependent methyltransferase [Desulfobacteraceae bacterium]